MDGDDISDSDDEFWDENEQKENMERAAKSIEGVSLLPNALQSTKSTVKQSNLSKNQKLEIIEKESPELLGLLKDFEGKLNELKTNVQPLLTEYVHFIPIINFI